MATKGTVQLRAKADQKDSYSRSVRINVPSRSTAKTVGRFEVVSKKRMPRSSYQP